jgi:hypothetical protein
MLRPPQPSKRALTGVLLLYAVLTIVQVVVPALAFKSPDAVAGDAPRASGSAPTATQERVDAAQRAGCDMAEVARRATRAAHIPLYVGCAFLQQETDGGRNVFGHDPTVFAGAGEVTKAKYLAYKEVRERTGQMQGVGPMQLTWFTYQDRADRLGGAWKPYPNMLVGFRHLAALHRSTGSWTAAAHEYNGGGPMAEAYAAQMADRLGHMRSAIG